MFNHIVGDLVVGACVAVALTACGEVKANQLADAPTAPIDAAPMPVTVTVLSQAGDGLPDLTAKVLFQDPDGATVADAMVDATGHATAMLPRGGTVTASRVVTDTPTALGASITSITGVKPGDDLTFGTKPPGTITNQGGQTTMTANFTLLPQTQTPASYQFYTACGVASVGPTPAAAVVTLTFRDSCHGATFDLIVVASGGTLTQPLFAKLTNINYQSNGTFTIPAGFTTMSNFTVNLTNVPDAISSLTVTRSSIIDSAAVAPQSSVTADPPAGASSVLVPFPQGFETRSQLQISLGRADSTTTQVIEGRSATLAQPVTVDVGNLQVPWITGLAHSATGATWSTVVPGGAADGTVTQWAGRWTDGTKTSTVIWRVVQPADATGMKLPKLPAAYAAIDPGQQTLTVSPVITANIVVDYDQVNGYDDFRRAPETLISSIGTLGAFVNMPFQRRMATTIVRLGVQ
jgi:hypothetical protein